jgi:hypothetical protein
MARVNMPASEVFIDQICTIADFAYLVVFSPEPTKGGGYNGPTLRRKGFIAGLSNLRDEDLAIVDIGNELELIALSENGSTYFKFTKNGEDYHDRAAIDYFRSCVEGYRWD